jgi:hypothetical protein
MLCIAETTKATKKEKNVKSKEKEINVKVAPILPKQIDAKDLKQSQGTSKNLSRFLFYIKAHFSEPEVSGSETIIYDNSGILYPVVPDLEAIAAPNTEASLTLASMNNETYLNILNMAYEKVAPQFPEMVAVVNVTSKEEIAVVSVPNLQPEPVCDPIPRYFLQLY